MTPGNLLDLFNFYFLHYRMGMDSTPTMCTTHFNIQSGDTLWAEHVDKMYPESVL